MERKRQDLCQRAGCFLYHCGHRFDSRKQILVALPDIGKVIVQLEISHDSGLKREQQDRPAGNAPHFSQGLSVVREVVKGQYTDGSVYFPISDGKSFSEPGPPIHRGMATA
jgi:hypothetical protein